MAGMGVVFSIDKLIPAAFFPVYVIQLGQNHLEGLVQGVEDHDFPALAVPLRLGAEVGIDEQQRLHRQRLQLQVPGGVVGGNVADVPHLPLQQPLVGVVVVEIGHPLPGAAAELAQIVGGGSGGNEGQVDFRAGPGKPLGHGQGDVVDPGDVPQGFEGGRLQPQAHQLIQVLLPPGGQEAAVGFGAVTAGVLLLAQKAEVHQGIGGQLLPLQIQQNL